MAGCRTFWTEEEFTKARSAVDILKHDDPRTAERVDVINDASDLEAHRVNPKCPGATVTAGAASLWPYKLVAHMVKDLIRDPNVNLQTNTPVERIERRYNHEWTVRTPRGGITTKHIILATNAYTSHLLPEFTSLIVPCRGTMTALIPPKQATGQEKMLPNSYGMKCYSPDATAGSDDYLIQRPFGGVPNPRGHLMFGGGKNAGNLPVFGAEAADDSIVDPGPVKYLQKGLLDMLKLPGDTEGLSELKADYAWSGIMGFSKDNAPWVGEVSHRKGIWVCAGYTGHGMPNATLCAKAVVDLLLASKEGRDSNALLNSMVKDGRIPSSYLITRERLDWANGSGLPSVQMQEATDCMGFVDGRWSVVDGRNLQTEV